MLNALDLCVACFEYKGKRNLANQAAAGMTTMANNKSSKDQLADVIFGVGSAKERLARRRQQNIESGTQSLRWEKTFWQVATEQSKK